VTTGGKSIAYVTDTFNEQLHAFSNSFVANGTQETNLIESFGGAEGQFDNPIGIGVHSCWRCLGLQEAAGRRRAYNLVSDK
jgi:hypothetical protein